MPQQSSTEATVGRVLHAYSNLWHGPRAAVVCNAGPGWRNINVELDAANDRDIVFHLAAIATGRTFTSVPLFDALTAEDREAALNEQPARDVHGLAHQVRVICEWPPKV